MHDHKKKKVLLVVSTLNTGGAQRAFANMSMGFPKDWECDFLLNDDSDVAYSYRGKILSLGIKPQEDKTKLWYQMQVFAKRYLYLRRLKKTGQYAACISALTSANVINVLTGNKYCKTIISIRIFMSQTLKAKKGIKDFIKLWSMKFFPNYADHVIAVSKSMEYDIVKNFNVKQEKAETIYNGYQLEDICKLSQERLSEKEAVWFEKNKRTIVTVGRLDVQKGQEHLIRAFAYAKKQIPELQLLILGEGELREKLAKLVCALDLEDSVVFCGFLKNPYKIVKRSYIFVLPSLFEGFPNTLAESLCLGVPVISTDCDSGAREILAPDTEISKKVISGFEKAKYGLLCPVCENDGVERLDLTAEEYDMAEAILYLLRNQDAYEDYQKQCKVRAEQLSIDKVIGDWIRLIEK